MAKLKVSLITTVFNEEDNIADFIKSIERQTQPPDEVIFVDAGSTDKTTNIIKKFKNIKLIVRKNINRSQGRNIAIKNAKHPIIAVSDAGCTLDQNWLKQITKPFTNKSVDSVAGFYHVKSRTIFQKCLAPYVAIMPGKLNPKTYLPSSRSIAFRKSAFKKVSGYPEHLNYCEDLIFAKKLKTQTNLIVKPSAIVYWQMANSLTEYFHQIRQYALGDIKARHKPHLKKIFSVFIRYLLFISVPPTYVLYQFWPAIKHFKYIKHPFALIYLPIIQFTTDLAIITATLQSVKIPYESNS